MLRLTPHRVQNHGRAVRIEILGVFGSGKTTLATALSQGGFTILPERHELNAFWREPATNQITGCLPYDLWFLLHHAQLAGTHSVSTSNTVAVCDWSFQSDRLWARMRLADDFALYDGVYETLYNRLGPPSGYLYLKQPPDIVVERLKQRGRQGEAGLVDCIQRAATLLDKVVELLPPQNVMTLSGEIGVLQISERIAHWRTGAFDGR